MKRLSIALMALGLSTPAFADSTLYVPSQHGGFKVAIDPLYLRKNSVNDVNDSIYDFGGYAQIGYLFPYTGNDLSVDYTYLRSGDKETVNLDAANVQIGQRLTTGVFDVRLFSGIRYAHLNYTLDTSTPTAEQSLTSLFHGFGPTMGIDARYQLGDNGFGFDTHLNTALLVGTVNDKLINTTTTISDSMNRLIPEVEAKLGVDYTYPVLGDSKSAFSVEVGYQTTNYFHTFNSGLVGGLSDASFDGAYAEIKFYS